jgi:hypothetical protein
MRITIPRFSSEVQGGGLDAILNFPGVTQDLLDETTILVCVLNRLVALTRKSSGFLSALPSRHTTLKGYIVNHLPAANPNKSQ